MEQDFSPEQGLADQTRRTDQKRAQEEASIVEQMMRKDYRSSMTVTGEDIIREVQESVEHGDMRKLERAIKRGLPLTEGLEHGIFAESYGFPPNIDNLNPAEAQDRANKTSARLRNMFVNVEESIDRANTGYLRDAMLDAVTRPIRELEEWDADGGAEWRTNLQSSVMQIVLDLNEKRLMDGDEEMTDEEMVAKASKIIRRRTEKQTEKIEKIRPNKERLLELELHMKARFTIDSAFRQRQYVAHDKDLQGNMKQSIGLGVTEPDTPHLEGFYQVDIEGKGVQGRIASAWGDAVDKVEREFVKLGEEGKFKDNLSTKEFNIWLTRALAASKIDNKHRMDVVWAAWRMFCIKEIAGKYALKKGDNGSISFDANTPFVGDMASWISHPEERRAMEYGWNIQTLDEARTKANWNGNPIGARTKVYRAISHSGPSITIGRLTTMSGHPETGAIAAWGKDKKGNPTNRVGNFMEFTVVRKGKYGENPKTLWDIWRTDNLSQASIDFPWVDTEVSGDQGSTEAGSGAFGYWFLQRGRAVGLLKNDILGVPKLGGLDSVENVANRRTWDKLGMVRPGTKLPNGDPDNPFAWKVAGDLLFYVNSFTNKPELRVRGASSKEVVSATAAGHPSATTSAKDYLSNCENYGLLSSNEVKWVLKTLSL